MIVRAALPTPTAPELKPLKGDTDDHLSTYFRDLAEHDLLGPEQERELAQGIEDQEILTDAGKFNFIVALNKIDKVPSSDVDRVIAAQHSSLAYLRPRITPVSAKTGEGVDLLKDAIIKPFAPEDVSNSGFLVSDARHHDLLIRTKSEIEDSIKQLDERMSEEIVLIGLHNALRYLGDITGETTTEDMLGQIFSTFCIGK